MSHAPQPDPPSPPSAPISQPEVLQVESLQAPKLIHGFTTRRGGVSKGPFASLNFGPKWPEDRAAVAENHRRLAKRLGYDRERLYLCRQVHGAAGVLVTDQDPRTVAQTEADFLVTARPGVTVGVITADCVGVLMADPEVPVVAAAHAGWRGLVAGVLEAAVTQMVAVGARAEAIRAALGPSIGPCCFEVGPEVVAAFERAFPDAPRETLVPRGPGGSRRRPADPESTARPADPGDPARIDDRAYVDLAAAARLALARVGISEDRVAPPPGCTRCEAERFHSYRRDGPRMGQQIAVIGIRP